MAFFIALPYVAYTVWKFVVPALFPHEKRTVKRLSLSTCLLFIAGVAFCFFLIIPAMMRFSLSMQSEGLEPAIGLSNYIVLVGMLLLGFGIMFQLPIVVLFLALSGIIKLKTIKKMRPIVLIIILTLSALLTPPDVFSQLMMAVPTYLLFEISLLVSSIAIRNKKTLEVEENDNPKDDDDDFFQPYYDEPDTDDYNEHYRKSPKKRKMRYMSRK